MSQELLYTSQDKDRLQQNSERVFKLANNEVQEAQNNTFYKIHWDETDPLLIDEIITMHAQPVGALRQESRVPGGTGTFNQALYDITTVSDRTGVESNEGKWWLPIYPASPSEELLIIKDLMSATTGYKQITIDHLVKDLLHSTEGVGQHVLLLELLNDRQISATSAAAQMRRLTVSMLEGLFEEQSSQPENENFRVALFGAMKTLERQDPRQSRFLQSRIVSIMLSKLPSTWGDYRNTDNDQEVNMTLKLMSESIESGALTIHMPTLNRLMINPALYRSPEMTNHLAEFVNNPKINRPNGINIFATRRKAFIHDYIASVLDARVRDIGLSENSDTSELLESIKTRLPHVHRKSSNKEGTVTFGFLYELADRHGYLDSQDTSKEEIMRQRKNGYYMYDQVSCAFSYLLQKLDQVHASHAEAELNQIRAEIVDTIFKPSKQQVIARAIIQAYAEKKKREEYDTEAHQNTKE